MQLHWHTYQIWLGVISNISCLLLYCTEFCQGGFAACAVDKLMVSAVTINNNDFIIFLNLNVVPFIIAYLINDFYSVYDINIKQIKTI